MLAKQPAVQYHNLIRVPSITRTISAFSNNTGDAVKEEQSITYYSIMHEGVLSIRNRNKLVGIVYADSLRHSYTIAVTRFDCELVSRILCRPFQG
jgi:hypothetical protein